VVPVATADPTFNNIAHIFSPVKKNVRLRGLLLHQRELGFLTFLSALDYCDTIARQVRYPQLVSYSQTTEIYNQTQLPYSEDFKPLSTHRWIKGLSVAYSGAFAFCPIFGFLVYSKWILSHCLKDGDL
jgi:hypothetical protein